MRFRLFLILLGVLAAAAADASAQGRSFVLSANAFLDSSRTPATRITVEVPLRNLIFFKKEGLYDSRYEVYLSVGRTDEKGPERTFVMYGNATVATYEETRRRDLRSRTLRTLKLEPGDYRIEARLLVRQSLRTMGNEVSVQVPDFLESGIGFGTPTVVRIPSENVIPIARWSEFKDTGDLWSGDATPLTTSFDTQPAVRFELFLDSSGDETVPCNLFYEVVGPDGREILYGRQKMDVRGQGDSFGVSFYVDDWIPGIYRVNLRATVLSNQRTATASTDVRIDMTRSMLTVRFDETLEILALIAHKDELTALKEAAVEDRPAEWTKFWNRRDPDQSTEVNEALEQHLARIQYVNMHFAQLGPGWRSDRGRIYIMFGPPDDEDRVSDSRNQGEYLIWRYFSHNRTFVFYDRFGVGDYRLEDELF